MKGSANTFFTNRSTLETDATQMVDPIAYLMYSIVCPCYKYRQRMIDFWDWFRCNPDPGRRRVVVVVSRLFTTRRPTRNRNDVLCARLVLLSHTNHLHIYKCVCWFVQHNSYRHSWWPPMLPSKHYARSGIIGISVGKFDTAYALYLAYNIFNLHNAWLFNNKSRKLV